MVGDMYREVIEMRQLHKNHQSHVARTLTSIDSRMVMLEQQLSITQKCLSQQADMLRALYRASVQDRGVTINTTPSNVVTSEES